MVSKGNYVAVVCEREEQAISAARQLKVNWQKPATRAVPGIGRSVQLHAQRDADVERRAERGRATPTRRSRARRTVVEAEYEVPFQGHTAIGPAHAMADPSNGQMTIYSNDMKSYGLRNGVAQFLKMPRDRVRVVWMDGPQGYGRTAADDAGFEAAFLAKEIGRPVRVQWMRHEETAWDTKGPAYTFKMRGGLDAQGNLVGARLRRARRRLQSPRLQRARHRADRAADGHAARRRRRAAARRRRRTCTPFRTGARRRTSSSLPLVWETPLRTGNLRDPNGPQVTFASESFIDELAAAAKADPVEFRLKLLDRQHRPTTAASSGRARSPWSRRRRRRTAGTRGRRRSRSAPGTILTGRGIAYAFRSQTVVAQIAEVEVNRRDRPRLGEAARLRARLRAGDQSRGRCAAPSRAACCTR